MKQKYFKAVIVIIIILIIAVITGIICGIRKHENQTISILSKGVSKDGNAAFIVWEGVAEGRESYESVPEIIDNKYVWGVNIESAECKSSGEKISYEEITSTYLYSLETGEVITYDMKKLLKQHIGKIPEGYGIDLKTDVYREEEKTYLVFVYNYIAAYSFDSNKYIYIDIETGETFLKEEGKTAAVVNRERYERLTKPYFLGKMTGTNLQEINALGPINLDFRDNVWEVTMKTEDLPKENKKLYTMFPDLKEAKELEGRQVMMVFDELDDDDFFELFLEDGQEISYEGCVIYAHSSVDGKEHVVNSKEEFDLYYEEVSYEQVLKNHAGETDEVDDHLPPYVEIDGLESGKEYYTTNEEEYVFSVFVCDDFSYNKEVITVKTNGEEVDGSVIYSLPVSDEKQTVEITVSDTNGNSQTIVIKDVLVTYQEEKEEAEEKKKNFTPIVLGVVGGLVLLAAGGIIIGLQIRGKKKQKG